MFWTFAHILQNLVGWGCAAYVATWLAVSCLARLGSRGTCRSERSLCLSVSKWGWLDSGRWFSFGNCGQYWVGFWCVFAWFFSKFLKIFVWNFENCVCLFWCVFEVFVRFFSYKTRNIWFWMFVFAFLNAFKHFLFRLLFFLLIRTIWTCFPISCF